MIMSLPMRLSGHDFDNGTDPWPLVKHRRALKDCESGALNKSMGFDKMDCVCVYCVMF